MIIPILVFWLAVWPGLSHVEDTGQAAEPSYIGSQACGGCHSAQYKQWSQSLHSKMIQKAGPESVLGDFVKNNTLEHEGTHFEMSQKDGSYWVREVNPGGRETLFKVDYTLGSKRTQHYLSLLSDGRIRVVFPTWDVQKQMWFHSSEIIPTGDHADVPIQIWNQHCYNCHVSQEKQSFDIESNTYKTTFTEPGINCEMCHGPGSVHAKRMAENPEDPKTLIVNPRLLPPQRQLLICVQCHTPRIIVQNGFNTTKNYYDYYMPTLMHFYVARWYDPPMWADGRMRRFATEGAALWQSQCYLKGGVTCFRCHNPHLNTIKRDPRFQNSDGLCTQCHEQYKEAAKVAAHTHHPLQSEGSHCVSCHMPPTTNMIKDHERDHSISIPVPDNTALYKIPNACNVCHTDRTAQWSVQRMDQWYPKRPKANLLRAKAFTLAQKGDPAAVDLLIELLRDPKENTVVRGSAAGFLGDYKGEKVASPLIDALSDPDIMVRAEAARSLSEVHSPASIEPLKFALHDENQIVRLNSVFALIKLGILGIQGPDADAFQRAKTEYERFLQSFPDIYGIRVDSGTVHALQGEYFQALVEYENAVKLRPELPLAHYYMGVTYTQLGRFDSALESFQKTLEIDPSFRNTRELIEQVKRVMSPQ